MTTFPKKSLVVAALLGLASIAGMMLVHAQETTTSSTTSIVPHSGTELHSIESYSDAQLQQLINALAATPLIWPTNLSDNGVGSTYWSLAHPNWPPMPAPFGTPFWNLTPSGLASPMSDSAMSSDSTASTSSSGFYLLDDVDYPPSPGTNSDGGTNTYTFQPEGLTLDTNSLYLEVPTNNYSAASNYFNVLIHNTTNGDFYDVLTKTNLTLPSWTVENTVTGAVGNVTPVTLSLNGRTNLFVWARTAATVIDTQPLTQEVVAGDSVTFSVAVTGSDLSYQWTFDGTNIYGATGSSYTINNVNAAEAGDYACIVTSSAGTVTSQTATLTVDGGSGDAYQTQPIGQRQDYTFRNGVTYYVGSTVQLYGNTTFEAGTIIKFDYTQVDPCLQIFGTVTCKGTAYNPSILTTYDDNAFGEEWSDYSPQPYFTGVPYLDLSQAAGDLSLTNVWFRYADEAVSTPAGGQLDVWNGQFFQCNAAILNESNGVDSLHNVLLAGCGVAVAASTNAFAIAAENITADVTNLYTASVSPSYVVLTNSIVTGNANGASLKNSVDAPDPSNFQTNGTGNYYLAANSTLRQAGTANISPYLLDEFHSKTTYAPIALPEFMSLSGNLTLSPQVPRYTNGAPDIGYYYDAMDYTVAGMTNFGTITVLPGTVIGFRQDLNTSTFWGFDLREESSFVSHGTPAKPVVFTDVQWVQEQYAAPCYSLFVPDFEGGTNDAAPVMDFRFCNFYPAATWYEVWAGQDENSDYMASYDSVVNWTMRDCNLHCGWISLGEPDNGDFFGIPYNTFYGVGSVTWDNNLFENEFINLQPSYYWYDGTINVDMAFSAHNNLFHGEGNDFVIASQTSSSGNWTFEDNLFDQVNFYQDTALPLDYDYNGYWPLTAAELQSGYTNQFQTTTTGDGFTDGGHEQVLSDAPPYVAGAFGDYYLSSATELYEAGSQTAGAAGLAQYTVFANQTKDAANSPVNIGLHYVAATNNVPVDSDGDGIPDYVEDANGNGTVDAGETDPNNAMSDGVTNDIYNAVYDNVDLSGDGLVGRIKKALGMNPLDPSNPLTLTQVITGDEPDIATFELPISYSTLTNIGELNLNINGADVEFEDFTNAGDGNTLLEWNTTYEPPGQGYLQAQLTVNAFGDDTAIITGVGMLAPFYSTNIVQFFEQDGLFDTNGAYLDAQLPAQYAGQSVSYAIQLDDPSTTPSTPLKTITGSTTSGMIQEDWNLVESDGSTSFAGDSFTAAFNVTFPDGTSGKNTKTLNKIVTTETIGDHDGFDFVYMYMPTNNDLAADYGDFYGNEGYIWLAMLDPVDTLLSPQTVSGGSANYYTSSFDTYDDEDFPGEPGDPGYCDSISALTNSPGGLYPSMADGLTKNFYCKAHGSGVAMASYVANASTTPSCTIYSWQVASLLNNHFYTKGGLIPQNPYRFVFLDGCSTDSKDWRRAFGIMPFWATNQAVRYKLGPQAFVAWATINGTWIGGAYTTNGLDYDASINLATAFARNLADDFYYNWISGVPLASCITTASNPQDGSTPFPVPQYKTQSFTVSGNDFLGPYNYTYSSAYKNLPPTSPIYVIGHSGLKRYGVDASQDNYYHDPADHP